MYELFSVNRSSNFIKAIYKGLILDVHLDSTFVYVITCTYYCRSIIENSSIWMGVACQLPTSLFLEALLETTFSMFNFLVMLVTI